MVLSEFTLVIKVEVKLIVAGNLQLLICIIIIICLRLRIAVDKAGNYMSIGCDMSSRTKICLKKSDCVYWSKCMI